LGPTRYVPPEPVAVLTVTPAAAGAAADVLLDDDGALVAAAAVAALELELLPHPATINPAVASAATPAMRNLPVLRLAIVLLPH